MMKRSERDFVTRTCEDYVAWCKRFYVPEALDEKGMKSLDGLWAWQAQEGHIMAARAEARVIGRAVDEAAKVMSMTMAGLMQPSDPRFERALYGLTSAQANRSDG